MNDADRFEAQVRGIRLAGFLTGPPDGERVVLLHALGEDAAQWDGVVAGLGPAFRVLALDLRGHGASDWPGEYSYESMRDDVLAVLDQLGWTEVTLIGHSLGGVVAYLLAQAQPKRVARLIIEDVSPPYFRAPRNLERPAHDLPFDWALVAAMDQQMSEPDLTIWDHLSEITAPTLIIGGGPSSTVPQEKLAQAAAAIPQCTLITIPAGHHVHEEEPAAFIAAIQAFLAPPPNPR